MTRKKVEDKCPTCGSRVTIEGNGTTHYYAPLTPPDISEEEIDAEWRLWCGKNIRSMHTCQRNDFLAGFRAALKKYRENV